MSDRELGELEREARATPEDPEPAAALAHALLRAGRTAEARSWSVRAAERALDDPQVWGAITACATPLVVLPRHERTAMVVATGSQVAAARALPFVAHPRPSLHPAWGLVAGFDPTRRWVGLLDLGRWERPRALALPERLVGHSLAFHGPALYVGTNGERLLVLDLDHPEQGWRSVGLPRECFRWGKAIDALVLDGDRLIAVDDIRTPRYSFLLDVRQPLQPRLLSTSPLGDRGTVRHAALGSTHLAVLSGCGGDRGPYDYVAFLRRSDLSEERCLAHAVCPGLFEPGSRGGTGTDHWWHDVAMLDSVALIAAGSDGLEVFDLRAPPRRDERPRPVALGLPPGTEVLRVVRAEATGDSVVLALGQEGARSKWPDDPPPCVGYRAVALSELGL